MLGNGERSGLNNVFAGKPEKPVTRKENHALRFRGGGIALNLTFCFLLSLRVCIFVFPKHRFQIQWHSMSVSCFGIELPSNRLWLRKEECRALRGSGANLDWRAIAQIGFPIYVGDFSFTAKRKFLMRYLFSTTQKPDGFADRATKQSADKVNDVAMLTLSSISLNRKVNLLKGVERMMTGAAMLRSG